MESRAYAIAVGIFSLVLGISVILAYWWLSGSEQARTEYTITSKLPVNGLNTEATVKFRGVTIGKVTKISIDPSSQNTVLINISVAQSLRLSNEAYAELRLQGLTGLAYLDLNDEGKNAPTLPAGGRILLRPTFTDRLISKGPELISQLEVLLRNSNQLAVSANHILTNFDTTKLNLAITNFEKASEKTLPTLNSATNMFNRINKLMSEENQAQLVQTLESVQQTSDAARPLVNELSLATKKIYNTANQIEIGTNQLTSTLEHETLPQLHALTQNMNQSAIHFNQLIDVLEDNPQSIIFGNPAPSPGPGEEGFFIKP